MWYRVFGTDAGPVPPASLLEHLHGLGFEAAGHFRGDEQGWFQAELRLAEGRAALQLERYLAEEEGIRDELNTWAAWLEEAADDPQRDDLMRHLIATAQLFTLRAWCCAGSSPGGPKASTRWTDRASSPPTGCCWRRSRPRKSFSVPLWFFSE
jgi:hypothetical protein